MPSHPYALPSSATDSPRSPSASEWILPIGLVLLGAIPILAGVARLADFASAHPAMDGHERFAAEPITAVAHIGSATVYCLVGAFQFSPGLRRRSPIWHRRAGFVLFVAGFVAALAGIRLALVIAPSEHTGPSLGAMRVVVGAAMAVCLVLGLVSIRRGVVDAHRRWMARAYALGIAAGTQALIVIPQMLLGLVESERSYALSMGAGWGLNLLVVEWAMRRGPRDRFRSR